MPRTKKQRCTVSFMIDATEAVIWGQRQKTVADYGEQIIAIHKACQERDFEFLKQFPFIIKVYKGTAKRASTPPSVRRKVLSVGFCAYCGSTDNLQVDHIKPVSKGGSNAIANLQCLCRRCNRRKSDYYVE